MLLNTNDNNNNSNATNNARNTKSNIVIIQLIHIVVDVYVRRRPPDVPSPSAAPVRGYINKYR